ncbi:hypothetical protein DAPPUDRAFT_246481 [Daphnia pulex]|uniref:Uncharacterized protein n=1 Tax=Daphnia pulex TaxID=6669 RepID=E9GQM2_DAPPU|nr:hypothetical protein DAPPUDRAFT_246481 [Daphnia pulex]|eukprot:EFX78134.1 hypothetical protein DAPPUDRAFT_246481 [Daphnia pulex]
MQHALNDLEVGTEPRTQPCGHARCVDCRANEQMAFIEKQTNSSQMATYTTMDVTADHEEETGGIVTDGVEECPVETEALHRVSLFSCGTFHPAGLFVSSNLSSLEK